MLYVSELEHTTEFDPMSKGRKMPMCVTMIRFYIWSIQGDWMQKHSPGLPGVSCGWKVNKATFWEPSLFLSLEDISLMTRTGTVLEIITQYFYETNNFF